MTRTHRGHAGMQPNFSGILGMFLGMVCRPCLGRVLAAIGMQPNFQAFVGSLWARCAGHVRDPSRARLGCRLIFRHFMAISRIQCAGHVRDASWSRDASRLSGVFRQFLEHDVQAMFGIRLVRSRDAACFLDIVCRQSPGLVWDAARMQPDFQAFLGSFRDMVHRRCPGRGMDVA
ncbi:Hypothetical predicted protein [Olea europaea subsp. europaea]|uniref:Uncharacterized protein n=1 Tax=Olea europaea subsp. europaea TaxID=158383 RepID=A0A8S0TXT5_OLEEU|nr:Hypothetical predicted protein [Olea europaea subsp. europaea]